MPGDIGRSTSENLFDTCHCAVEYVLELFKFRDSVVDISKLSPMYDGIIEQLKKYAVVIYHDFATAFLITSHI